MISRYINNKTIFNTYGRENDYDMNIKEDIKITTTHVYI